MSTPQIERLQEHCHRLRLYQIENQPTAHLEQAAKKEVSYADFLDELRAAEVAAKTSKHHQMRIAMARFPFQKTLESFDFKFQPSIDPKLIRELATGRYMHSGDNVLFLGPRGVGRSHLAVALGMKACEQGARTLFVTATALITALGKALAEGRLEERLKLLIQPQLLIIDEIGYLPIDRQGANLFFQLVSRRFDSRLQEASISATGCWSAAATAAAENSAPATLAASSIRCSSAVRRCRLRSIIWRMLRGASTLLASSSEPCSSR